MQGLTLALALTGASALVAPAAPRAATALKAGRMCMLASIGMVVPSFVRVPGEQFQGSYIGWEAHDRLVASGSLGQILLFVGLFETLAGIPACVATMNGDREPGDFEFGGIFKPTDPVQLRRKQNAELKNE